VRLKGRLVDVWPYAEAYAPASTFVQMWDMMLEDNTLRRTFYEFKEMTFPDLVRFFDSRLHPSRLLLLVTDKQGRGAGFGWFDDVQRGVRAFVSVCMSKFYWGPPADEAGEIALDYCFHCHDVPTIYGITPKPNRMALAQAMRMGFKPVATLPGFASFNGRRVDVTLTMNKREEFDGRRRQQ